MPETKSRIMIWRGGLLVPRVAEEPLISSAGNGWDGVKLERHHLNGPAESKGIIDGFQVCFNLSGPVSAEWLVDGEWRKSTLNRGDLCLATHGEFRSVTWQRPYELLLVCILPLLMGEVSAHAGQIRAPELAPQRAFRDANIEKICRLLLADTTAGTPAGAIYGEHLACSLAVYLAERFGQTHWQGKVAASTLPGPVLKRVCDLIEARLNGPIGLLDLAIEANMSRYYFSRLFRSSTGESPYRYLMKRRIERAKDLLARKCTLDEVAAGSGFASSSHLSSLFRRYTGMTPHKFRSLF